MLFSQNLLKRIKLEDYNQNKIFNYTEIKEKFFCLITINKKHYILLLNQ